MDFDLIFCSLCDPGTRPDRLPAPGTPRHCADFHGPLGGRCLLCIPETITDNRSVREHLRIAARNHVDFAAREGRRLTEEQIADIMLNMLRHLHAVVQEFKLARVAPRLTGGTPDQLREIVYAMVAAEARHVAEQERAIDQVAQRDGWGDRESGAEEISNG